MFSLSWPPVKDTGLEQAQAGVSSPLGTSSTALTILASASAGSLARSPVHLMAGWKFRAP